MEPVATTVKDAAQALSLGRTSIYALLKQGKLEKLKCGRRTLITIASIHRFVADAS